MANAPTPPTTAPPRPGRLGSAARAGGIAVGLFLALFAFDAWEGDANVGSRLLALVLHLVPTWLCLGGVLVAWRRAWLGGVIFAALALVYAWWAREHPDWILVVSGPLVVVAGLYTVAWRRRVPSSTASR